MKKRLEKQFCDCGKELILNEDYEAEVLDEYDGKQLICSRYYCNACWSEYEINEEVEEVEEV